MENAIGAAGQVAMLTDDASRIEAYRAIGAATRSEDFDSLFGLIGSLPEKHRNSFIVAAIPSLANDDPKKAAQLLEGGKLLLNELSRNRLVAEVAIKLANSDPSYATHWMDRLPQEQQPYAMEGVARQMANYDLQGLSDRLAQSPRDKKWAAGVKVLIESIRASDPEMSESWQNALNTSGFK